MAAKQQPASEPPFFRKSLSEPNHEWRSVGIDDLCRFFTNPCRYFIQRRLGVVLKKGRRYEDTESFRLVGLDRFAIGTDMVAQAMGGEGPGRLYDRFRGEGRLPEGPSGRIAFFTVWSDALKLAKKASGVIGAADTRKIDIDIRLGPFDMVGTLESIHDSGQSMVRYAKLRSPHLLTAWIRHLAFCLCGPEDLPKHTVLVTRDQRIRLLPVADPAAGMEAMLKWYWEGLTMPLPLYDAASLGFAQRMVQKAAPFDYALERAAGDLIGTPFRRGDMDDPYVFLSTRGRNPIDTLFQTVALGVFEPIFAHLSVDG
jgi:exodeoxyribonuclease V gamma subunit